MRYEHRRTRSELRQVRRRRAMLAYGLVVLLALSAFFAVLVLAIERGGRGG